MAGFFQSLLSDVTTGFFGNEYLRDYTHASQTFRTNGYAYSPKFKFNFHVYFDINTDLIMPAQNWPKDSNFGLAVKTIQLPKYSFDLHTLNQYNRKRVVQTKIKYDPVNIVFHDDNANLIRKMWYTYYTYYYKDATQWDSSVNTKSQAGRAVSAGANFDMNRRNMYDPSIAGNDDWGYIGETGSTVKTNTANATGVSKAPFFKAINIYGFNQHSFALYRLVNPMIESFSHDTYDYAQGNGVMENQMSIQYETVKYYEGALDGRNPGNNVNGFGDVAHYDTRLSPIATPGSNATIMGQGGLIAGAGGILDDLENGNILGAVRTAGITAKTFKNPANILKIAQAEALGVATDYIKGTPNRNNVFAFPVSMSSVVQSTSDTINGAYKGIVSKPATPPGT
jgi:hypothetical protein